MKARCIDYSETGSFSQAIIRYLERDPALSRFQSYSPDLAGFAKLIQAKNNNCNRDVLRDVLTEQYARASNAVSAAVHRNVNLLSSASTFTVTTGHQLNLFTGPLYFIFKIVSTINLARELKTAFPDKDFVPVYWMATEDHDFAEINHTYIAGKKVSWPRETAGATGRISTEGMERIVAEYVNTLGLSAHAEELGGMVKRAYLEHSNLADATRYMVNALFGAEGLVVLDADDARLKKEFAPVILNDIRGQHSYKHIQQSSAALKELGLEAPVNPREINFFYLDESLRERIVAEDGNFAVLNTDIRFSVEELEQEINTNPQKFSPNVVMRPLYQEVILPNLAYIGGGAEIVYWLQFKANFDFYKVDFPILLLRNSAMLMSGNISQKMSRFNLSDPDVFLETEELKKMWVRKNSGRNLSLETERAELEEILNQIRVRAEKIDVTLGPSTEAVRARLQRSVDNLEQKLLRAEKRNHAEALQQLEKIRTDLFPQGGLQERKENFGLFYVKYGDQFIKALIENFRPLDLKFTILED